MKKIAFFISSFFVTSFVFAADPCVVELGGQCFIRATTFDSTIQAVLGTGAAIIVVYLAIKGVRIVLNMVNGS